MRGFIQSFKDKRLRYGAFSTLTAVFVIAILVAVNLLAARLNLSYDLSREKLYSVSDKSKEALAGIAQPVTVYSLLKTGMTDAYIDVMRSLLEEYPRISPLITLEYKDPYLYPQFVEQYRTEGGDIPVGSVIVEGAGRFKVIPVEELVTEEIDYQTMGSYIASIDVEPQVTNAILYVLGGETPALYKLGGHDEAPLPGALISRFEAANYTVNDLALFNAEAMPEGVDLMLVTTPQRDWTEQEAALVSEYLANGGRALFFIDFMNTDFPNMEGVLAGYGVEFVPGLVLEGDSGHFFQGNPMNLLPMLAEHEITQPIADKGYPNIVPMAMAVGQTEITRQSVGVAPLMVTSESAYAKTDMNSQSVNKEPGDLDGPFIISAAVEEYSYTGGETVTKLVVTAAESILNDQIDSYVMGVNYDYVLACANWTQDAAGSVYISPKTSQPASLVMNAAQAFMLIGVSLLIPVAIIVFGVAVWLRRRGS